ncbi:MAG: hypothetical protein LBJ92_04240 [Holosporales bacterium]|nr:hypothetical protein [Holosporales bacterium]
MPPHVYNGIARKVATGPEPLQESIASFDKNPFHSSKQTFTDLANAFREGRTNFSALEINCLQELQHYSGNDTPAQRAQRWARMQEGMDFLRSEVGSLLLIHGICRQELEYLAVERQVQFLADRKFTTGQWDPEFLNDIARVLVGTGIPLDETVLRASLRNFDQPGVEFYMQSMLTAIRQVYDSLVQQVNAEGGQVPLWMDSCTPQWPNPSVDEVRAVAYPPKPQEAAQAPAGEVETEEEDNWPMYPAGTFPDDDDFGIPLEDLPKK